MVFLYTNDETSEKEIQKTVPIIIESKTIKFLGQNLTKEVKELYNESYKTFLKEIEEDTNEKITCVHGSQE